MFTLEGLREVRHGKMAGLTDLEIRAKFPEAWAERDADRAHWRFPQGESYFDAAKRVSAALAEIDSMGYRRPLLVAHEMISRLIRGRLLGIPLEKAIELRGTQGSLEVLQPARSCELEPESSAEREGRNDMAD